MISYCIITYPLYRLDYICTSYILTRKCANAQIAQIRKFLSSYHYHQFNSYIYDTNLIHTIFMSVRALAPARLLGAAECTHT